MTMGRRRWSRDDGFMRGLLMAAWVGLAACHSWKPVLPSELDQHGGEQVRVTTPEQTVVLEDASYDGRVVVGTRQGQLVAVPVRDIEALDVRTYDASKGSLIIAGVVGGVGLIAVCVMVVVANNRNSSTGPHF
jgi:hypothetical protein